MVQCRKRRKPFLDFLCFYSIGNTMSPESRKVSSYRTNLSADTPSVGEKKVYDHNKTIQHINPFGITKCILFLFTYWHNFFVCFQFLYSPIIMAGCNTDEIGT